MSVWDEGVPPEIDHDDLYPLTWNPANLLGSLQAIPGLPAGPPLGTDGLTPMFAQQLAQRRPLVRARRRHAPALWRARRTKTSDEVACLRTAAALAEAALQSMRESSRPGSANAGSWPPTTSASGSWACLLPRARASSSPRRAAGRSTSASSLVTGRSATASWLSSPRAPSTPATRPTSARPFSPGNRTAAAPDRSPCVAGGASTSCSTRAIRERPVPTSTAPGSNREKPFPPVVLAHGLGLGVEPPVIGLGRGSTAALEEGAVMCLQSWVSAEGTGGCLEHAPPCASPRTDPSC